MRNLYSRLGIAPTSTLEEIRVAIQSCSHATVRKNATEVLLLPARRRKYDNLNYLLINIGSLRAILGLSHADNWDENIAHEYMEKSGKLVSRYDQYIEKIKIRQTSDDRSQHEPFLRKHQHVTDRDGDSNDSLKSIIAMSKILVVSFCVLILWGVLKNDAYDGVRPHASTSAYSDSSQLSAGNVRPEKPTFNQPPQPTPHSGDIRRFVAQEAEAPLSVETESGDNYLIKLETLDGKDVMDFFVRGGSEVEVSVPLGKYIMKYVSGDIWYGYEHYFGPESSYYKAESILVFEKEFINDGYRTGYRTIGHTITLYKVVGGNLSTSQISPDQF